MALKRAFAQEDTNLQTATVATSRARKYTDVDLSFAIKPVSGEIYKKTDAAAVKQAIKTLVLTNHLEKPFLPTFGGDVRSQLFELALPSTGSTLKTNIINTIQRYEPRAEIVDVQVQVQPDNYSLDVTVTFKIVNTGETVQFSTTLSRLR